MTKSRKFKVDYLARVEGEGAMYVKIKDNKVEDVKLKIYEPPRFFEGFLRGRRFTEAPDITARICGICPIAYQMSSVHAMEYACNVRVRGKLRELRRLVYCGEWIESHALHIFMLHLPDFLGYQNAIELAKDHPDIVKRGLLIKKIGNELVSLLGGREVHPINVRVGGFYKLPKEEEVSEFINRLEKGREEILKSIEWLSRLEFPDFEREYEFVALRHEDEYPFNEGRITSNKGLDIKVEEFEDNIIEEHVKYSNALHARLKERGAYFVGSMARYNLNFDRLPSSIKSIGRELDLEYCNNPFKSILVRSLEILYAFTEAIRISKDYKMIEQCFIDVKPRDGVGYGCTEAPRGILYHRYNIDDKGIIKDAKIIPPTSQNQKIIEEDLYHYVSKYIDLPDDKLIWRCEQAIRNYDPCISCATHFLKAKIER
ncbi:MAG: Ni/Fe hydrogenase subunit alpha [Candidatus Nitrosocaldaceae archaeon]|nr:MAG: Ni/Fe hydrogenase subunit alpha [Candidatus Nitrosocaldaceae archaeon]GIU72769.1 MAG: Ni/Fe hydrogenase subunit alpha [Candidatus Nitrosocaldaceae archaeon]GIU72831.1 MAG: Ni/Fe hydrogenase subunit alpha [Candidatus Nitrosocaldaceae archaeon]